MAFSEASFLSVFTDPDLSAANAIRNVMAHKGGIADKEFLGKPGIQSLFPSLSLNQPVPIDGKLTCKLTNGIIDCGETLIRGVDDWLDQNPD
jgi:hypothetical protein